MIISKIYHQALDLEKTKAPNLGCKLSPENGKFVKLLQNQGFLY